MSAGESSEVGVKGEPIDDGVRARGDRSLSNEVVVVVVCTSWESFSILCGTLKSGGERGEDIACSACGDCEGDGSLLWGLVFVAEGGLCGEI